MKWRQRELGAICTAVMLGTGVSWAMAQRGTPPNLSAFRDRGGKLILWHGCADPLSYAEGTTDYYTRVLQQMGGGQNTSRFIRLFMAPGVGHCGGGTGPAPRNVLDALIAWVEQGQAPETLSAVRYETGKAVRSRPLCQYPMVARYIVSNRVSNGVSHGVSKGGRGSTDEASSFECKTSF